MINIIVNAILVIIIIASLFYGYIFYNNYKKEMSEEINETSPQTIYNDSPILWKQEEHKKINMENHYINSKHKNIFVIENNDIYQRILFNIYHDTNNIYFFNDGEDFLNFLNDKNNKEIEIDIIVSSDDCPNINGLKLFNILNKDYSLAKTNHIILTTNRTLVSQQNKIIVFKPFDSKNTTLLNIINKVDDNQ